MKNPKTKKIQPNSTFKVRFIPTTEQKQIFRRWLGTGRFCYNRAISMIGEKEKINFQHLRNLITPKKVISKKEQWLLNVPKDVRAEAVREAVTAIKHASLTYKKEI